MPIEKRKSKRILAKVSVKGIKDAKDPSLGHDTRILYTKDISRDGARIVFRGQLVTGERLILMLSFPQSYEPVAALSEVRWFRDARASASPHLREAGVKFVQIDSRDISNIERFISSKEGKESSIMAPKKQDTDEYPRSGIYV